MPGGHLRHNSDDPPPIIGGQLPGEPLESPSDLVVGLIALPYAFIGQGNTTRSPVGVVTNAHHQPATLNAINEPGQARFFQVEHSTQPGHADRACDQQAEQLRLLRREAPFAADLAEHLVDIADVVVIEPRDAFVHNVAALRGLVDPEWADRLFFPYDQLLSRGRVVHDRAVRVDDGGVTLSSGTRIHADYIVLATGSGYPFPAKHDVEDTSGAKAKIAATHAELQAAARVLLLGAGPVGLELAGEIKAAWPDKSVTIVDPASDILSGNFPDPFRHEVRRQLEAMDIQLMLRTSLTSDPPTSPGHAECFAAITGSGTTIEADIWFRCFGVTRTSVFLLETSLAPSRQSDGSVDVTDHLHLLGHEHVFAIGDLTSIPETKLAKAAGDHAEVVAANIRTMITGSGEMHSYAASPPAIALPLGPRGGASYAEDMGILDAATTSMIKGADLRVDTYAEMFGATGDTEAA